MLPLVFLPDTPVLLAGGGPCFDKRRLTLQGAGLHPLMVAGRPMAAQLEGQRLVFGAGLSDGDSEWLAAGARARGIPVNIEDVPHLCDFHMPALVRRGGMLLSVSTGGGAPSLSSALRAWLAEAFDEEWEEHLHEVASLRARLRQEGRTMAEVTQAVHAHIARAGWLPTPPRRTPVFDG